MAYKPWTRDDTREWITQLELRVEDIDYYLQETVTWLEEHDVERDEVCFACAMMTVVWVAHQRCEAITRWELMEILGVKDWQAFPDEELELGQKFSGMDLEHILTTIVEEDWLNRS